MDLDEIVDAIAEVQDGTEWLGAQQPSANITWAYDIRIVTVDVEPWTGANWPGLPDAWYGGVGRQGHRRDRRGAHAVVQRQDLPVPRRRVRALLERRQRCGRGVPEGDRRQLARSAAVVHQRDRRRVHARVEPEDLLLQGQPVRAHRHDELDDGRRVPEAHRRQLARAARRVHQRDRRRPAAQGQRQDLLLQGRPVRALQRGRRRGRRRVPEVARPELGRDAGRLPGGHRRRALAGQQRGRLPVQGREVRPLQRRARRCRRRLPGAARAVPRRGGAAVARPGDGGAGPRRRHRRARRLRREPRVVVRRRRRLRRVLHALARRLVRVRRVPAGRDAPRQRQLGSGQHRHRLRARDRAHLRRARRVREQQLRVRLQGRAVLLARERQLRQLRRGDGARAS